MKSTTLMILGTLVLLTSCNLFKPFSSTNEENYDNYIIKGNEAFNDGKYDNAMKHYEKAQELDYQRSEAWVFHSKAIMRKYNIEYATVKDEIDRKNNGEPGLPFVNECAKSNLSCIDSIYYPIAITVRNLTHIVNATDTGSTGMIDAKVVVLDIGLLQAMIAMLNPLDLDDNYRINNKCGYDTCGESIDDCTTRADSTLYNEQCIYGADSEVRRFNSFKALTGDLDISNLKSDELDAKDISRNPNEINQFINDIAGPAGESNKNLGKVNEAIGEYADDKSLEEQLSDVTEIVGNLNSFLQYYMSADSADNDFDIAADSSANDFATTGRAAMTWHDFDADHFIRYDYTEDFTGSEGIETFTSTMGSVGHPVHRNKRPELYLTMKEFMALNSETADTTSTNSRTNNMIDACVAIASANNNITNDYEDILVDTTCVTISSVLRADAPRPASSDWVSGTFGVDEEVLDDYDNDFDGIQNEDSRLQVGADDDVDAQFSQETPYDVQPMTWSDGNNNKCIDIDTDIYDANNPRRYCIGTLEHRLYLAINEPDSLEDYYRAFTATEKSDDQNECMGDLIFFELGSAETIEELSHADSLACTVSHRWKQARPSNSDWTGGTFGIDEEFSDGVDNDGDGYIDEDITWGGL